MEEIKELEERIRSLEGCVCGLLELLSGYLVMNADGRDELKEIKDEFLKT